MASRVTRSTAFGAAMMKALERYTDPAMRLFHDPLAPDLYSIRVSLSSFLPAIKQNILVQPGRHFERGFDHFSQQQFFVTR